MTSVQTRNLPEVPTDSPATKLTSPLIDSIPSKPPDDDTKELSSPDDHNENHVIPNNIGITENEVEDSNEREVKIEHVDEDEDDSTGMQTKIQNNKKHTHHKNNR